MCMGQNPNWSSEASLVQEMKERAKDRRILDRDKRTTEFRPDAGYRPRATMCYAANMATGGLSVGYSGGAGGMTQFGGQSLSTPQALRSINRLERLEIRGADGNVISFSDPGIAYDRPRCNCAEARAVSIALSWGENASDLVLVSFGPSGQFRSDEVVNPCQNCMEWVLKACAGYADKYERVICGGRRDPDGGSRGGGGMGFGGSGILAH